MTAQDTAAHSDREPIAVIGSGFRFPGSSNSPSKFWEFLLKPRDVLKRIPDSRFNIDNFYHPDPSHHGTTHVKESYFLDEDHRHFDAGFFNIKPVEVPAIDPQQRLLMEVVYESLEAAGLSVESLAGSHTGVYVGLMCGDYSEHLNSDINTLPTYTPTGNARSIMSNRISYFFDWHGPSMTIDTACSSSMVAVHQAVQLLRSGDSDVAVAAGSNLILGPGQYVGASGLHMLSADSRSRMWDADGTGYARGEGVAAVILKRLSSAISDGDEIECVIRETGVNQDGRTKGITVPNSAAQMGLIARTYAKAGLDPRDPRQRCQYFEAHGTGTGAGDPKEAEAISKAFFHPGERITDNGDPLYVGSIKTVIGHSEGTAGIAGLLKASLAIQHGTIPPNLLFNKLHSNIEPFYTNLKVLTSPRPWPTLPDGVPRRASVNSFGFGGTNSHIILESAPSAEGNQDQVAPARQFAPFNFSAASEASLRGILSDYSEYLQLNPDVRLCDLSYTLYARRSEHAVRASVSAKSAMDLQAKIDELLQAPSGGSGSNFGTRSKTCSSPIRVLAVFTGQSAQWPTMGRELVTHSAHVRQTVQELDLVLQALPEPERPKWTLMEELTCDASESRVHTAAFAQPLSTVIQIILYDLLSSTGIKLHAIVGHSSGEVAVAYAKGYITREEAVKIAYYRGYFSTICPANKPGAMMAVGTSAEDANELCNLPMFQGRLCVAAYNSPSGVTLSGDVDAIEQAREALEDEKKFARVLKVDKAYHSPHMKNCATKFHDALKGCEIQPQHAVKDFVWPSSTYEDTEMRGDAQGNQDLSGPYWVNNLLRPVLFSHAVQAAAAAEGPFDVAIELGPHASLKGPVSQTLQESQKEAVSYHGLLHRGKDDVEAFSDALGSIWSQFSLSRIDFKTFDSLTSGDGNRTLIKDVPTYHWDHERLYWHGPRASKVLLGQTNPPNPLLGSRTTDTMEQEIRWRNLLRLSELPWIRGHQLQGQVIYPATAYVATAIEAARFIVPSENIALVEIQDFSLGKPLVFRDDDAGIETLFTLSEINKDSEDTYSASFTYHASTNADVEVLSSHATGRVLVTTGEASSRWLPSRQGDPPNLVSISHDRFYSSLQPLGYGYSGYFKTLSSIQRRLDFSSSHIMVPPQDGEPEQMLLHPALLDSALQGIFLAYCWPGDGSLDQLYVPTGIKSFRVNVGLCKQDLIPDTNVVACSHLTGNPLASKQLHGDVNIYTDDRTGLVQIEGVKVVAFAEPTADADKKMFAEHKWGVLSPNCEVAMGGRRATADDYEFALAMERVSIDYMRQVTTLFPETARQSMNLEWHFKCLFQFFSDVIATVRAGTRQFSQAKWLEDAPADIAALKAKFGHKEDMKLACAVGDNLPAVLRGETTILEHLTKDGLLDRFYEVGMGLKEVSYFLGQTVKQVVHRHPRMKMLEIGAGTGGATKVIMGEIGRSFSSYTFTDISTGFFETAQEVFSSLGDKMIFKPLDCEKDIVAQGYQEHSYDLVVASLVLHATTDLRHTLANARRLLKPGGYLIMQEVINNDVSKTGFLMCAMPGWWLGQNDGRTLSPCVSTVEWHKLLLESGFSGVDSSTPEYDVFPFPLAVIVSQAVDDRISLLREPLSSSGIEAADEDWDLVLIGGQSLGSSQLIEQIIRLAQPLGVRHVVFKTLGDIAAANISPNSAILCVAELDEPVFKRLSGQTLQGMQKVFETQRTVLWITQGSRSEDPYMNMTVGLGRSLLLENPDLVLQFLDLEVGVKPNPRQLLESLLRLRYGSLWEKDGTLNNVLWTNEQELAFEKGELMVSRLYHDSTLNNRYNSCKRTIYETMDPQTVPLSISDTSSSKPTLVYDSCLAANILKHHEMADGSEVLIKVSYSLLMPVLAAPLRPAHLVLGTNKATGKIVLAISDSNGSYALVPSDRMFEMDLPAGKESHFMSQLDNQIRVENVLSVCQKDSTLLLHEPSPELLVSVAELASCGNIKVFLTSSTLAEDKSESWIFIDPFSPKRVIKSSLPSQISVFIDCAKSSQSRRVGSTIASCLPQSCLRTTLGGLQDLQHARGFTIAELSQSLRNVVQRALKNTLNSDTSSCLPSMALEELVGGSGTGPTMPAIVDWSASTGVPVQISTVDSQVTFKSDKTYVLFGLTSDLAQSVCDWMASHGARNIVLTSRNPKVDAKWIELLSNAGVRLEVFANDITDKDALSTVVDHIRQNFPPIAGIAHGAMVLDDISFFEMPLEKMNKVLQPKVKGAIYLDELFQEDTLDFFVLFSSVTAIAGNRGQSAYSTANMFMTTLATQRRNKGLAASILHIGAVMGVGYINRGFSESIYMAVRKVAFMLFSEREFHLCFGEAVLASHPLSGRNPELVTALKTTGLGEIPPQWTKFPRFQHCFQADDGGDRKTTEKAVSVSTKVRLVDAITAEEILDIVQDAFVQKLQVALQISAEKDKYQILSSGTDDLGIDSLVAVEIRSWFLKEVETEVPVFKVLSGGSVQQLLEYVVENIPASLTPNRSNPSTSPEASTTPDSASSSGDHKGSERTSQLGDKQDKEEASSVTSASTTGSSEIDKLSYEKVLPISPGQSRFWFQKHLMEDQTTANSTICVSIDGKIRLESLEHAVRKVAARHEALRTSFFIDENQKPVQAILETSRLFLEKIDLTDASQVVQEFESLKNHVYDLEHGECMRLIHLAATPTKGYLLIGSYHIIMDGISLEVLLNDLQKAYNRQSLPKQVYQYSEYSEKLREELTSGALHDEINYWKSEFTSTPSPLPLLPFSAAKSRATLTAYEHNSVSRTIDSQLADQIQDTCRKLKANVFHFHLGVFEVLLFKLFGNGDVCIGMADANRLSDQVANSIGMYLNLLPLRFHLGEQQSFEEVLKHTRRKAYLAMSNSRLPFDVLLDNVACQRTTAVSPLFQAFINYRQGISEKRLFDNAAAEIKEMALPRSGYDISLDIIENPGSETRVTFMLQQKLYSERDATRLLDMYFKLLGDLSRSCDQTLQQCSLFADRDVSDAIQLGKGPVMPSKWPETLIHRIQDMITKHPDKISLRTTSGQPWTYRQLDAKIDQIASALLKANTKRGSTIAVFQEASPHFICSLLAILRTGAVYVPLDTNIPPPRLRVMIRECDPSILLVNTTTLAQVEKFGLSSSVTVLDVASLSDSHKTAGLPVAPRPRDPAAILFTSGTSGIPKGVVLSHGSLCNHVEALTYTHGFRSEVVLQQSSVGFDMSLNQIFMALANGGTLIIIPEIFRKDPVAVSRILLEQEVTYTSATPSEYLGWFRHGSDSLYRSKSWKYATAGGEKFPTELLQAFKKLRGLFEHPFHAFNAYGPTEASMSSNEVEIDLSSQDDHQHISVGKALPNYSVYIMDPNLSVLPIGFPGEICIAGAGVAIEYLNNPDESAKKFLKDPLTSTVTTPKSWDRMYRTGDQGVLHLDGTLEVLGRIEGDTQVKLRGLRIELRDVELSILDAAKGRVEEAVVTPRGDPTILLAHAVLSTNADDDPEFLRELAASLPLPQYMRPAAIIPVDTMPLNSSGKIDRKSLQNLPVPIATQEVKPTRELTDTESKLAQIWRDTLPQQTEGVHAIDAAADFFHVGGNSMLLIELRRLVNKRFQLDLSLIRLFENSTLGAMATTIQHISTGQDTIIDWEVETGIPNDFLHLGTQEARVRSDTSHKTVVLTGSTGFLGSHILRLLVESLHVERIHCIAIRNSDKLAEFSNSDKVVLHSGDLSLPRCGLPEAEANAVFASADSIIHNGADVSFLKTYSSLKAPNFSSTKELARLAFPRRIPIHFVSTATVGKFNRADTLAPKSLAEFTPDTSFANGYAASKWVSEVFLEKASRQLGLPVFIHRPSSIMGDEAGDDIMSNVLQYGSIIEALPESSRWTGYVDLVSLHNVASGIVRSALQERSADGAGAGVEYLHHSGDQVIPVQKIKELLNGDGGIQLESLPMREWVDKSIEHGMNPLVGEFLRNADEGQGLQIGQKLLLSKE